MKRITFNIFTLLLYLFAQKELPVTIKDNEGNLICKSM